MNEEIYADSMEETEDFEVTTSETEAAIEDDWYNDGYAEKPAAEVDEADGENSETDQSEETETANDDTQAKENATTVEEQEAQQTEEQTEEQKTEAADQRLTVKHLETVRELDWAKDRDEIKALVQKGMDYDRKTQKLGDTISEYEEFLDSLAQPAGLTRSQLMDSVRAKLYVEAEKAAGREITEQQALFKVQQDRADKKRVAEEEAVITAQKQKQAAEEQQRNMLQRFANTYPNVKATDIPPEVWQETHKTGDLVSAYAKHENSVLKREKAELERQINTLKQNAQNAQKTTGSRKSAGKATEDSDFDAAWYDGT